MRKTISVSWAETSRLIVRSFKTLYQISPRFMTLMTVRSAWLSLAPYVGIYLSSLIIGELAGEKRAAWLTTLIIITLTAAALITLGTALIDYKGYLAVDETKLPRHPAFFEKKLLELDFVSMEDLQTQNLFAAVRQIENSGNGLKRMWWIVERTLQKLFTILGGIIFTISMFIRQVPVTADQFVFLNHPALTFGLIGILVLTTIIFPLLSKNENEKLFFAKSLMPIRSYLHKFWTVDVLEKRYAADVRMNEQQQLGRVFFDGREDSFESPRDGMRRRSRIEGVMSAVCCGAPLVFNGMAYAYICLKAWNGAFGVGLLVQYMTAVTMLTGAMSELMECISYIRANAVYLKTEYSFLDISNRMYQGTLPVEKRDDNEYEFAFHNVSFKYPGSDSYALKNVNLHFKVGSRLAVVGINGSGKTTMIKLLCRFYDPIEGEITLNGINIKKYRYNEYLDVFSVVFQDFRLFSYKLGENVAGTIRYDKAKVRECLEKVGFAERLESLQEGLDTYLYKDFLRDGLEISKGDAQKIALARALYKDAPFVILDEPTAALDSVAEAEIYEKINDVVRDKTTIFISHRLSSCRFCDEIAVFDHGELVQHGSHEELVAKAGKYRELWNAQAQFYV